MVKRAKSKSQRFWKWISSTSAPLYAFSITSVLGVLGIALNDYFNWDKLLVVNGSITFLLVGIVFLAMSKIAKDRFKYWKTHILKNGISGNEFQYLVYLGLGVGSIAVSVLDYFGKLGSFTGTRGFIAILITLYMGINLSVEMKKSIARTNK